MEELKTRNENPKMEKEMTGHVAVQQLLTRCISMQNNGNRGHRQDYGRFRKICVLIVPVNWMA